MSKIFRVVGLLVLVAAFMFCMSRAAVASPPVDNITEGFYISTTTDVEVIGDLVESEEFEWVYGDEDFNATDTSMTEGSAAQVVYYEDLTALSGYVTLHKPFEANSDPGTGKPNLSVGPKTVSFVSDNTTGSGFTYEEGVGLAVVSYGARITDIVAPIISLCPWVTEETTEIPATNESIMMGSKLTANTNVVTGYVPALVATTNSAVTSTSMPAVHYDITASGYGQFAAEMAVHLMEGATGYSGSGPAPALKSETTYHELVTATGVIAKFDKTMDYKSKIPEVQTSIWNQLSF